MPYCNNEEISRRYLRDDEVILKQEGWISASRYPAPLIIWIPRVMIAITENYQQADGSITVPKVLQPYVGQKLITSS